MVYMREKNEASVAFQGWALFKIDQRICQEQASDSEMRFLDTVMFVSISIRQQTLQLYDLMFDYHAKGQDSSSLFGYKYITYMYMENHLLEFYNYYRDTLLRRKYWKKLPQDELANMAMNKFLTIPGLNMAKAGFLTQLLLGQSWCADVNNIAKFGIDYNKFITPHSSKPLGNRAWVNRQVKINSYLHLGQELGGSAWLWNQWCREIAKKYPNNFTDAQSVSELHWKVHDQIPF